MQPEQYIEKLRDAQRALDSVKEDLDRAIYRMQRRLETGYDHLERDSRLATLAGLEDLKLLEHTLLQIGITKLEY